MKGVDIVPVWTLLTLLPVVTVAGQRIVSGEMTTIFTLRSSAGSESSAEIIFVIRLETKPISVLCNILYLKIL
jgi:hypothetical protein